MLPDLVCAVMIPAQSLAEFRVVVLGRDFGFRHRVQTRVDDDDPQNRILIVSAVQFISGTAEVLSVYEDLFAALRILRGCVAPAQDLGSRRKQFQALEVSVEYWKFRQLFSAKLDRDIGAVGFELRRFAGDFYRLRGPADLKLAVDARPGVRRHLDVLIFQSLKTCALRCALGRRLGSSE